MLQSGKINRQVFRVLSERFTVEGGCRRGGPFLHIFLFFLAKIQDGNNETVRGNHTDADDSLFF